MIRIYSKNNGLDGKMGDTAGAQIIALPLSVPLGIADRAFPSWIFSRDLAGDDASA
jgi:hypothetical protein